MGKPALFPYGSASGGSHENNKYCYLNHCEILMKKLIATFLVILTFFWCLTPLPVLAFDLEVGQQVKLKTKTDLGIPLHRKSSTSLIGRIKDGTWAQVLDTAKEKHWLNIKTADGQTGWIIDDYVSQVLNKPILPNTNNNETSAKIKLKKD